MMNGANVKIMLGTSKHAKACLLGLLGGFCAVLNGSAAAVDIDLKKLDPNNRVIWSSERKSATYEFSPSLVDLGVSFYTGISYGSSTPTEIPIDLGNDLQLVITGRFKTTTNLKALIIELPLYSAEWEEYDPLVAKTEPSKSGPMLVDLNLVLLGLDLNIGIIKLNELKVEATDVQLHLVCAKETCDVRSLRNLGSLTTNFINITMENNGLLFSPQGNSRLFDPVTFNFLNPCSFNLTYGQNIKFRTMSTYESVEKGKLLDKASTGYELSCGLGMLPASAALKLNPLDGVYDGAYTAKFKNNDSIGLIYSIGEQSLNCVSPTAKWNEKISIEAIESDGAARGSIQWGVCAQNNELAAGAFDTVVEIEAWVD